MSKTGKQPVRLALNIILGDEASPANLADIVSALRAQADALEGTGAASASVKKPKASKKKKDEEESNDDSDGGTNGDDAQEDDADASEGSDGDDAGSDGAEDSEDSEGEEAGTDDDGGFGGESDGDEESQAPSKEDCIGLLKKLAAKKNKKAAMELMKKVTGKDSVHDVPAKKYAEFVSKLKAALK